MQFLRLWLDHGICLSYKLKKSWTEYPLFFFSWKSTLAWFDDGISGKKKDKNFNGQIGESIFKVLHPFTEYFLGFKNS